MYTNPETLLEDTGRTDPTWHRASEVVETLLNVPSHVSGLFRAAWSGQTQPKETLKVLGFSRLHPNCLLNAAGLQEKENSPEAAAVEHALQILGPGFSSVVLAINLCCRQVLNTKPPSIWRTVFEEMMTNIEIGYRLGTRVFDLGVHGGSLMGFALTAGYALLLANQPKIFKEWSRVKNEGKTGHHEVACFGCNAYQISSLLMQSLGFGHQVAIGIACGGGGVNEASFNVTDDILFWKAAYQWIEALRDGRNYPADPRIRTVFHELNPFQASGQPRNMVLEVIYTEIAGLRQSGSKWTWHLPRPTYEETFEFLSLQKNTSSLST